MQITTSIGIVKYRTTIETTHGEYIADEGYEYGGGQKGMNPFELLVASLGSCTCITLRMYCEKKEWNVPNIIVTVRIVNKADSNDGNTNIQREIFFEGDLSQEQEDRLLYIANHCPIHKILNSQIKINTSITK